ncbi:5'-nucleotidase [bacterium]|nr:5'-nucleotidase [bacterium]
MSKICFPKIYPLLCVVALLSLPLGKFVQGQSVLLSNLKSLDAPQTESAVARSLAATADDPFLKPDTTASSSPRVSSILETADVDDALLATPKSISAGSHEDLDALLWLRTAAEYDALTRQTYNAAIEKLGEALVDADWNALDSSELSNSKTNQPPCVIVDVDETVLDNSTFQLELIKSNAEYTPQAWNAFVQRSDSPAVEGAVEFMAACRASGVKVFFVTNREASVEASTRRNLIVQGLMTSSDPDRILSKNEQPSWTSDKTSRRLAVAEKYRILLLIGDDLNDFISAKNLPITERQQLYLSHKAKWGRSWFVLPNPNYGNWEQATYDYQNGASINEKRQLKLKTLGE